MSKVFALASVVIKELYRRKDFYVLFVLTAVITLMLGLAHFFNDPKIFRYLKEICLLLIWVSALVIAVTTTARQIPAERENRTILPLLAKPVTRAQVVIGKFLGCWLAVGAALAVFYLFFIVITGSREGDWPMLNYFQAFGLQWAMSAIVIALVLFGSVVFTSPAENVSICILAVLGILLVGGHLNQAALQQPEPWQTLMYTVYFIIPHLEWYDTRDFVIYNWAVVPWVDWLLAMLYAAVYTAFFLFTTWLVFRRKPLSQ